MLHGHYDHEDGDQLCFVTIMTTRVVIFWNKKLSNSNHTILHECVNTVVGSYEVEYIFNVYVASIASEIGFEDEHATPDEVISAYYNHPSFMRIRDAYGDKMQSFSFQTVNHHCVAKKL